MSDPALFTPARCHVNLGAIRRNFARLGQPQALMPVIKSDAYGHGLIPVAKTLAGADARRFAVGLAREGIALRNAGLRQDIVLLLGCLSPDDWQQACAHKLTPLAGSFADLEAAAALEQPISIAIKCDTGMGRLGFAPEDAGAVVNFLQQRPLIRPAMLVSHFACSDMPDQEAYTLMQARTFAAFFETLRAAYPQIASSICNSAATLDGMANDISRPGLALYGGNPFANTPLPGFEWAMSVAAPVIAVHPLAKGQTVSYGRIFTAPKKMRIAVLACGYATGFARNLSNKTHVLLHGRRCAQIGRICMSMAMVDASGLPDAAPGDQAWIMGGGDGAEAGLTAWDLAELLDTIPYELLCSFGSLNARVYADA